MAKQKKELKKPAKESKSDKSKDAKDDKNKKPEQKFDQNARKEYRKNLTDFTNWTGKLPVNLLNEHCQIQKWERVSYNPKKLGDKGYIVSTVIGWKNPQDQKIISIDYKYPHIDLEDSSKNIINPCETVAEARNLAATFTLHRLCFEKNLQLMLPPNHRKIWAELDDQRKQYLKTKPEDYANRYNSKPFENKLKREAEKQKQLKQQEARKQQEAKVVKKTEIKLDDSPKPVATVTKKFKQLEVSNRSLVGFSKKVWDDTVMIDLGSELLVMIEDSIKHHVDWQVLSPENRTGSSQIEETLVGLGFRKSHVIEALLYTNTFNLALEWLLFHLPEDDFPKFFEKQRKDSKVGIKFANDLQSENILRELTASGFNRNDILTVLLKTKVLEEVAVTLTGDLLSMENVLRVNDMPEHPDSHEDWQVEIEGLIAIYPGKIEVVSPTCIEIKLAPHKILKNLISVKVYYAKSYPNTLVGFQLCIEQNYHLASYIKLAILRLLANHIVESSLGDMYLYNIFEYLEENILKIVQNPGRLYVKTTISDTTTSVIRNTSKKPRRERNQVNVDKVKASYKSRWSNPKMQKLVLSREKLPAYKKKQDIVNVIINNKITLVTGETGSGKSTQVVQFILDHLCTVDRDFKSKIIVTQPRRISTLGLADRISEERLDIVGQEVGYIIRGENKTSDTTRIVFATTGVLLRMIQGVMTDAQDSFFTSLSYIFIDEVHERSVDSDFLLIILRNILAKFPKLRIVLMSATIEIAMFRKFFNTEIGQVHIAGRTFPITDKYLGDILDLTNYKITRHAPQTKFDDPEAAEEELTPSADSPFFSKGSINYEIIAQLCETMSKQSSAGAILIFLPGIMEISNCIRSLSKIFSPSTANILPLHSGLPAKDQRRVFVVDATQHAPRKIVVSTNIAETSITIPDVTVVIDSGRVKSLHYDPILRTTKLVERWCSKAEAKQRRGRSGRVNEGTCFKLYTEKTQDAMIAQPVPEILRISLASVYLTAKAMGVEDVAGFLSSGLDSPSETNIGKSQQLLVDIGALDSEQGCRLTDLGRYLSLIPADLKTGKILILGTLFGTLEVALTLSGIINVGSPFIGDSNPATRDAVKEVRERLSGGNGDLLAIVNAVHLAIDSNNYAAVLKQNHLSYMKMKEIISVRQQYLSILKDLGFVPFVYRSKFPVARRELNRNHTSASVLKMLIAAGFYPQIARVQHERDQYYQSQSGVVKKENTNSRVRLFMRNEDSSGKRTVEGYLHPSSVFFNSAVSQKLKSNFITFGTSNLTTKLYFREVTDCLTLGVVLFGGRISYEIKGTHHSPGIILDEWLPIRMWCKTGVLIKYLQKLLAQAMDYKLSAPTYKPSINYPVPIEADRESFSNRIIDLVINLVSNQDY